MTRAAPDQPQTVMPEEGKQPWISLGVIFTGLGTVSLVFLNRWAEIEPILESPAFIVFAFLMNFSVGAFASYWVLARPQNQRLVRAEGVINRLRSDERSAQSRITDLEVAKARLEERLSALEVQLAALTAAKPKRQPKA